MSLRIGLNWHSRISGNENASLAIGQCPYGSGRTGMLRLKGVENLASLRVVYLEPSGKLSMFPAEDPQPGLSIMPPREEVYDDLPARGAAACCENCGLVSDSHTPCPNCGVNSWVRATPAPKWRQ